MTTTPPLNAGIFRRDQGRARILQSCLQEAGEFHDAGLNPLGADLRVQIGGLAERGDRRVVPLAQGLELERVLKVELDLDVAGIADRVGPDVRGAASRGRRGCRSPSGP